MATAKKTKAKAKLAKPKAKPAAKKSAAKKSKPVKSSAGDGQSERATKEELASPAPSADAPPPIRADAWIDLVAGHVVLAFDKKARGWFDAKVEAIAEGSLVLRWHDYEDNSAKFSRKLEQVALKHPEMSKPA